ncbi:MAG: L-threonylcarbamoyladenylate synthase [Candidatus Nitrosocosmicus sp.]
MEYSYHCECLESLRSFAKIVDNGGIVIYPTDTVYGIGCDATNENSIIRLYQIKNRPLNKSLPVLTHSIEEVDKIAFITPLAEKLCKLFWPGQLTIILKAKTLSTLSRYATNIKNRSIAIRIPDDNCIRELIQMTNSKLLIGTSANFSQSPSSKQFIDIDHKLVTKCDAVLRKRTLTESNGESTILDISDEVNPKIVRLGSLPKNKIVEALNRE